MDQQAFAFGDANDRSGNLQAPSEKTCRGGIISKDHISRYRLPTRNHEIRRVSVSAGRVVYVEINHV